ncbi:MAG: hypothetical protein ACXVPU_05585 [Bacteroidia bacterium]
MATIFASLIALIISFSISLTISLKRKIFWLNSFIVLIIGFLINRLGILDFTLLKTVTNGVGDLFISCGLQYDIIINGVLFTTVGLLIYFNKWTNTFILKQYDRTTTTNIT